MNKDKIAAKEKAEELMKLFNNELEEAADGHLYTCRKGECAIIAINEILKLKSDIDTDFWNGVKKHVNNYIEKYNELC